MILSMIFLMIDKISCYKVKVSLERLNSKEM